MPTQTAACGTPFFIARYFVHDQNLPSGINTEPIKRDEYWVLPSLRFARPSYMKKKPRRMAGFFVDGGSAYTCQLIGASPRDSRIWLALAKCEQPMKPLPASGEGCTAVRM